MTKWDCGVCAEAQDVAAQAEGHAHQRDAELQEQRACWSSERREAAARQAALEARPVCEPC